MKKTIIKSLVLSAMAVGSWNFSAVTSEAAVQVNPIPGLREDFIKGADVSMLPEM